MQTKLAVITGASSGIGKACADLLGQHGYQVVNADKNAPEEPADTKHVCCDISRAEDIDQLYDQVCSTYGVPDVLISNAGVGVHEKLAEGDPSKWATVLNTNLLGSLRFVRAFLPEMLERKNGHVIFMSSVAAHKPHPYGGVYAASKAALEVIAETLRLEVQPDLKVCVVAPGAIETGFFKNTLSGPRDYSELGWKKVTPLDVAKHILYLLSLPEHVSLDYTIIRPGDQPF